MTSTSFNVGLTDDTRMSSRVLRPPGGGHTDIFGGEAEPVRGKRQGPPQTTSFQEEAASRAAMTSNGDAPASAPAPAPEPVIQQEVPISKPAPQAAQPQAEPPKRVRVPPGGFSSGLW